MQSNVDLLNTTEDNTWIRVFKTFKVLNSGILTIGIEAEYTGGNGHIDICAIKLEKGEQHTNWSAAPEEEKYIIIAGDINTIDYIQTNAEILYNKI